jgi:hypothetical protein
MKHDFNRSRSRALKELELPVVVIGSRKLFIAVAGDVMRP